MKMEGDKKVYGLIHLKKKDKIVKKKISLFDNESDEDTPNAQVEESLLKESMKAKIKKQTQIEVEKAMAEDPTVYEYDSILDDIGSKRQEALKAKKQRESKDKRPKYITTLLKASEERKREHEKREERKVQREREEEGGKYKDKDSFVTSSYKKKLEELEKQEQKEKMEEAMEAATEVTKQKDLSGFYRHLLRQTMGEEKGQRKEVSKKKHGESSDSVNSEVENSLEKKRKTDRGKEIHCNSRGKKSKEEQSHEREFDKKFPRQKSERSRKDRSRSPDKRSKDSTYREGKSKQVSDKHISSGRKERSEVERSSSRDDRDKGGKPKGERLKTSREEHSKSGRRHSKEHREKEIEKERSSSADDHSNSRHRTKMTKDLQKGPVLSFNDSDSQFESDSNNENKLKKLPNTLKHDQSDSAERPSDTDEKSNQQHVEENGIKLEINEKPRSLYEKRSDKASMNAAQERYLARKKARNV